MRADRRRAPRRCPGADDPLAHARLRTGAELHVAQVSDLGALVRTSARLLPGTHVDVHLMTVGGRVLRRARVARASVWRLAAADICFEVALAFDAAVDTSARWVGATRDRDAPTDASGHHLPAPAAPAGSTPQNPRQDASRPGGQLASELDMGAGYTFAKESRDVVQH